MTLQRLKWLAVFAPLLFLAALEFLRQTVAPELFRGWPGYLLLGGGVLLATLFFAEAIFGVVSRLQEQLRRQNRELLALHGAGLNILGERDVQAVLQLVVDRARDLVGARYGALSLPRDADGSDAFLVSGTTPQMWTLLGPTTSSMLTVPVISQGRVLGHLCLAEKAGRADFDADDERTLERFATITALAIENARLHRQLQALAVTEERERIAREMHDNLAQVLGYVNTKAQATEALLAQGQSERAAAQLDQLATAARAAYADVREGILGLRASLGGQRDFVETLRDYLAQWQGQSGVRVELSMDPVDGFAPRLTPNGEVQLLRIIQEALANVRKHANATRAEVHLAVADGVLLATVADDGAGFDPEALGRTAMPRFGLATMRERAEAIGGTLAVTSASGGGTTVAARIPLESMPRVGEGVGARPDR